MLLPSLRLSLGKESAIQRHEAKRDHLTESQQSKFEQSERIAAFHFNGRNVLQVQEGTGIKKLS